VTALLLVLTGCVEQTPSPTSAPTGKAPTSAPTNTTPPSSPSPTPTVPPTPVSIACAKVLTPQQVYDFNPNYVASATYAPGAGTPGAHVAADRGRVCGWVNETSGVKLEVAIARPAPNDLGALRSEATGTTTQLGGGAVGFFHVASGIGSIQIFSGTYWIVVSSADIAAEGDVDPIAKDVLGNLAAS
jgi:hypothetical protein